MEARSQILHSRRLRLPFSPVPYRYIYIGLGFLLVAAVSFGLAFGGNGDPVVLPGPIESISPSPGDLVPVQSRVEIDFEVGYRADVYVDGWLMQDVQVVNATGVHRWAPSSSNPTINEWSPGEHTIRVVYDTVNGLPDPGEFEWTFRVGQ